MIDLGLLAEILTVILAVLGYYVGNKYSRAKKVLEDLAEAIDTTAQDLEDNKITPDELKQTLAEWKQVIEDIEGPKNKKD